MKRILTALTISSFLLISISVGAQAPPPPPSSHGETTNQTQENGGGAPLEDGMLTLIVLGVAYGSYKLVTVARKRVNAVTE
ncbi:MAG: hypothetical protein K9I34_02225 [Bacteroidales bacterium]|nr:hypothetical protein [Bacteroidales bacterium]